MGNVRVSYNQNLEITDQNDYYAFGSNIPREEKAVFGEASLYNYKFGSKELQETGFYDFGARILMTDLGRWATIDPLSEANFSENPYNYVLGNPINLIDPDGRKQKEHYQKPEGSEGFFSSGGGGFADYFSGGGSGFGSDINSYLGNTNTFPSGFGSYGGSGSSGNSNSANTGSSPQDDDAINIPEVILTGKKSTWGDEILSRFNAFMEKYNSDKNWYELVGKANTIAGFGATGIEKISGSFRMGTTMRGFSPKYYGNAWTGNQYAETFNIGKIGKGLGYIGFGAGVIIDGVGVWNHYQNPNSPNTLHPIKATINTGMGAWGLLGGPPGVIVSAVYTSVDVFYPGGWVGASETAARTEANEQATTGHPFLNNSAIKQ